MCIIVSGILDGPPECVFCVLSLAKLSMALRENLLRRKIVNNPPAMLVHCTSSIMKAFWKSYRQSIGSVLQPACEATGGTGISLDSEGEVGLERS